MKSEDNWVSFPVESETGTRHIATVRTGLEKYLSCGKYICRIDVALEYAASADGMPIEDEAGVIDACTEAFKSATTKDPAALLIYLTTGEGRRVWTFQTRSLHIFRNIFNRALEPFEVIPFEITAAEDPEMEEYRFFLEAAESLREE